LFKGLLKGEPFVAQNQRRNLHMNVKKKTGLSARDASVEILGKIECRGGYAEPLLDSYLSRGNIDDRDKGLITELVYGVLRNRNRLDWAIAKTYNGEFDTMETIVRNILRAGIYQLFYTDRIPHFAAVNEAVETAKRIQPKAAGLVNAILHKALAIKNDIKWPDIKADPVGAISIMHSHPSWMVERWTGSYGIDETIAICRGNNTIPPLTLRVNTLKIARSNIISALKREGISAAPTLFSPDGVIISNNPKGIRETDAFHQGLIRVQDEASQLAAHLLDPQTGDRVLDLCAGNGGKTLHIAALMQNNGTITAADTNPHKLEHLLSEAKRLGATIVETIQENSAKRNDAHSEKFDKILVDAPCSGLGTLRRNPEIRWRVTLREIKMLKQQQKKLLQNAAGYLKPGGALAYCVCTTTPEENEEVVFEFLKDNREFTLKPPLNIPPELVAADGFLRTFPHMHGMDGFFGALFVRKA
jgi:16S rRNA (cytosine967-C5)-methyltransferase